MKSTTRSGGYKIKSVTVRDVRQDSGSQSGTASSVSVFLNSSSNPLIVEAQFVQPKSTRTGEGATIAVTDVFTAVVLLQSPRRKIVVLAAQAITQYANTGGETAVMLLQSYGVVEKLLAVLRSPMSLDVLNAALLALGSVCDTVEGKRAVRVGGGLELLCNFLSFQHADTLKSSLWTLLRATAHDAESSQRVLSVGGAKLLGALLQSANEETVINAIVVLGSYAVERSWQDAVGDEGGIVELTKCLSSRSEEIQMKAAWALSRLLFQHDRNKERVNESGALRPLINAFGSSNTELLLHVLVLLSNCAENEKNKEDIRKLGGIRCMVALLTSPVHELRARAAVAIANCVEDNDANKVAVLRANGLPTIVGMLWSDKDELVANSTLLLGNLSTNALCLAEIRRLECLQAIVDLMKHQNRVVLLRAISAIGNFAQNAECRADVRKMGGLLTLLELLASNDTAVVAKATWALARTSVADERNKIAIGKLGGFPLLLKLLEGAASLDVRRDAAITLANCADQTENQTALVQIGALQLFSRYLIESASEVRRYVSLAVGNMVSNESNKIAFREMGGIASLIRSAMDDASETRQQAAWALGCCVFQNLQCAHSLREAGGIPVLVRLLADPNEGVVEATVTTLGYCAEDSAVKLDMLHLGAIPLLVSHLSSVSVALRNAAVSALALCVQLPEARSAVLECEGGVKAVTDLLLQPEEPLLVANAALILGLLSEADGLRSDVHRHSGTDKLLAVLRAGPESDVLARATLALHYVTQNESAAAFAREQGAVSLLVELLAHPEPNVQKCAALAVSSIAAYDFRSLDQFGTSSAITHLVHLMGSESPEVQSAAAHALGSLGGSTHNKIEIRRRGGQNVLVSLLSSAVPRLAETAMWALWKCAFRPDEQIDSTLRAGIVPALLTLFVSPNDQIRKYAIYEMSRMTEVTEVREEVRRHGGIPMLVRLLDDPNPEYCQHACTAIGHCARNHPQNTLAVTQAGGVRKLVALLPSSALYLRSAALLALRNCVDALPECMSELVSAADNDEAIRSVVRMLTSTESPEVQTGACMLLEALVRLRRDAVLDTVLQYDGLPSAVALLRTDDASLQHASLCLLRQLLSNDASVVALARRERLVEPLVELLKSERADVASLAASIIGEAAAAGEQEFIMDVVHSRGLKLLLLLLRRTDRDSLVAAPFALGNCARLEQVAERVRALGAVTELVQTLVSEYNDVRAYAAFALGSLVTGADAQEEIRNKGGLAALIDLLQDNDTSVLVRVTWALGRCSHQNQNNQREIRRQGGLKTLVRLLDTANDQLQENVAAVLGNCVDGTKAKKELRDVGGIERIVLLLRKPELESDDDLRGTAAFVLANAAANSDKNKRRILELGGISLLLALVADAPDDEARSHSLRALSVCAQERECVQELVRLHALQAIVPVLSEKSMELSGSTNVQVQNSVLACLVIIAAVAGTEDVNTEIAQLGGLHAIAEAMAATRSEELKKKAAIAACRCVLESAYARAAAADAQLGRIMLPLLASQHDNIRELACQLIGVLTTTAVPADTAVDIAATHILLGQRSAFGGVTAGLVRGRIQEAASGGIEHGSTEVADVAEEGDDLNDEEEAVTAPDHIGSAAVIAQQLLAAGAIRHLVAIIVSFGRHAATPSGELLTKALLATEGCMVLRQAQNAFAKAGGLRALLAVLQASKSEPVHLQVLVTLGRACLGNARCIKVLYRAEGFRAVFALMGSRSHSILVCGSQVLGIGAQIHEVRSFVRKSGALRALIGMLQSDNDVLLANAVFALSRCLEYVENVTEFRRAGGLHPLVASVQRLCPPRRPLPYEHMSALAEAQALILQHLQQQHMQQTEADPVAAEQSEAQHAALSLAPSIQDVAPATPGDPTRAATLVYCCATLGLCFLSDENRSETARLQGVRILLRVMLNAQHAHVVTTAAWALYQYMLHESKARHLEVIQDDEMLRLAATPATATEPVSSVDLAVFGIPISMLMHRLPYLAALLSEVHPTVDVWACVLCVLANGARIFPPLRRAIVRDGVLDAVLPLLASVDREVRYFACVLVGVCASEPGAQESVRKGRTLRFLQQQLQSAYTFIQRASAFALAMCCRADIRTAQAALTMPILDAVVSIVRTANPNSLIFAAVVMGALCSQAREGAARALEAAGVLPVLVSMAAMKTPAAQHAAAFALGALCEAVPDFCEYLLQCDGVRFLVYVTGNRATAVAVQAAIAAARALATCARHPACAVAMMDHGVLAHALALLSVSREAREAAENLLLICLETEENRNTARKQGGLKNLLALLSPENEELSVSVLRILRVLLQSAQNQYELRRAGGLKTLFALLSVRSHAMLAATLNVLAECAAHADSVALLSKLGVARSVSVCLQSSNTSVQAAAAELIAQLSRLPDLRTELLRAGVLRLVVQLLTAPPESCRPAVAAISALAATGALASDICAELLRLDAIPMLVGLLEASDTRLIAAAAHTLGVLAQNDNSVKTAIHTQRGLAKLAQLLKVADAYEVHASAAFAIGRYVDGSRRHPDTTLPADAPQSDFRSDCGFEALLAVLQDDDTVAPLVAAAAIGTCVSNDTDVAGAAAECVVPLCTALSRNLHRPDFVAELVAALSKCADDPQAAFGMRRHVVPLFATVLHTLHSEAVSERDYVAAAAADTTVPNAAFGPLLAQYEMRSADINVNALSTLWKCLFAANASGAADDWLLAGGSGSTVVGSVAMLVRTLLSLLEVGNDEIVAYALCEHARLCRVASVATLAHTSGCVRVVAAAGARIMRRTAELVGRGTVAAGPELERARAGLSLAVRCVCSAVPASAPLWVRQHAVDVLVSILAAATKESTAQAAADALLSLLNASVPSATVEALPDSPSQETDAVPRLPLGVLLADFLKTDLPQVLVRRLSRLRTAAAAGSVLALIAALSERTAVELHAAGALRACLTLLPAFLPREESSPQLQGRSRSNSRAQLRRQDSAAAAALLNRLGAAAATGAAAAAEATIGTDDQTASAADVVERALTAAARISNAVVEAKMVAAAFVESVAQCLSQPHERIVLRACELLRSCLVGNPDTARQIAAAGGMAHLVSALSSNSQPVRRVALEVIAFSVYNREAVAQLRRCSGLQRLLSLITADVSAQPTAIPAAADTEQVPAPAEDAAVSELALAVQAVGIAAQTDAEARGDLRRMGAVKTLVPLLGSTYEAVQRYAVLAVGLVSESK